MRTDWGRKWRILLLAVGLATMGMSACTSASHKQAACTADQISCETNDPCDESGCTNGCCLPKAVTDGGAADAGGTDGGCNCVIPDAGPTDAGCITDSDCRGATPLCNVVSGTCVQCNQDDDCDIITQECSNNACVSVQSCTSNAQCTLADNPVCDLAFNTCGECATDSDCPAAEGCLQGDCAAYDICSNNAACGEGFSCAPYQNGNNTEWVFACVTPLGPLGGGEPCSSDNACQSGFCEDYYGNDGWCISPCLTDADCGPDGWCATSGAEFQPLGGPDNNEDLVDAVPICMPKACTNNAECAGTGFDGGDRACALRSGPRSSDAPDASVLSWVESCLPPVGSTAGGTCNNDGNCSTYECLSDNCFDACADAGDCGDGGTCVELGVDAGYVDQSGNPISTCVY